MNHLVAKQKHNGRWEYTRNNLPAESCLDHDHETKKEAEDCYKEYLIANSNFHVAKTRVPKCRVDGCESDSTHTVSLGAYNVWQTCEAHANRETVRDHLLQVGERWES